MRAGPGERTKDTERRSMLVSEDPGSGSWVFLAAGGRRLRLTGSRTFGDREMGMKKLKPGGLCEGQTRGREARRLS